MITRRNFIRQSVLAGAALSSLPPALLAAGEPYQLTILHTNDMHSRIEPFPDGKYAGMGGMAQRATLIEKLRREHPQVLLLDSGDIFQGTPYFNFFGGELEFKLMSRMKYDAATIGNHDFDNGLEGLAKQLPHAEFPFLSANYDFSRTILKNTFAPYKIFRKGPVNVGVFGLGIQLEGLVPQSAYGQTIYQDPVAVAREMVQELQRQRCHLIVCLSHLGYRYNDGTVSDHTLAGQVDGIDIILGGHTHTFLDQPTILESPSGNPVVINQVGWAGIMLGQLNVSFERVSGRKNISATALKIA
jgi:5'-nucleotidase